MEVDDHPADNIDHPKPGPGRSSGSLGATNFFGTVTGQNPPDQKNINDFFDTAVERAAPKKWRE